MTATTMNRTAPRTRRPRPPTRRAVEAVLRALRPLPIAAPEPPKRRPPGDLSGLSPRARLQIASAHALHALRAFLLTKCERSAELLRHVHALEDAIDQLCPPDGTRVRRNGSRG